MRDGLIRIIVIFINIHMLVIVIINTAIVAQVQRPKNTPMDVEVNTPAHGVRVFQIGSRMSSTQAQIDGERDAMHILRIILLLRPRPPEGEEDLIPEIVWTRPNIERWTKLKGQRLSAALEWLVDREYLEVSRSGQYTRTTDGARAYARAAAQGRFLVNARLWRDEALTGMTGSGKRSRIIDAALPRSSEMQRGVVAPDPAFLMAKGEHLRSMASELGVTLDELHAGIQDGSIRRCPACGQTAKFHENQSACIACRKARRK